MNGAEAGETVEVHYVPGEESDIDFLYLWHQSK
jgi:hypothetical protein